MTDVPEWLRRARDKWRYDGTDRPPFADVPRPGQESVWDYPRPPRIETDQREVAVRSAGNVVAASGRAVRILETASPPTFYVPREDVHIPLSPSAKPPSLCEWKGRAAYWSLELPDGTLENVAWSYPDPFPEFEAITGYVSFYPAALECTVGGERARPQPGGFYGGWVTDEIVGPMKGDPGTGGW